MCSPVGLPVGRPRWRARSSCSGWRRSGAPIPQHTPQSAFSVLFKASTAKPLFVCINSSTGVVRDLEYSASLVRGASELLVSTLTAALDSASLPAPHKAAALPPPPRTGAITCCGPGDGTRAGGMPPPAPPTKQPPVTITGVAPWAQPAGCAMLARPTHLAHAPTHVNPHSPAFICECRQDGSQARGLTVSPASAPCQGHQWAAAWRAVGGLQRQVVLVAPASR